MHSRQPSDYVAQALSVRCRTELGLRAPHAPDADSAGVKVWIFVAKKSAYTGNLLLRSLSPADLQRLTGDHAPIGLNYSDVLIEPGERIRHVYFPIDSFISLITPGTVRTQLEIGIVGNEGMLGVPLLMGVNVSPLRGLVQGAGHCWRVEAATFLQAVEQSPELRATLNLYLYVFMAQLMQTASCTRFHLIQARLARWLLMTRDRAHSSQFHITHEFLACMLGVRRVGVTRAASTLQRRKVISYNRGDLTILDVRALERAACPCYATDKKIYTRILRKGIESVGREPLVA